MHNITFDFSTAKHKCKHKMELTLWFGLLSDSGVVVCNLLCQCLVLSSCWISHSNTQPPPGWTAMSLSVVVPSEPFQEDLLEAFIDITAFLLTHDGNSIWCQSQCYGEELPSCPDGVDSITYCTKVQFVCRGI